jgi:hypothetical protein
MLRAGGGPEQEENRPGSLLVDGGEPEGAGVNS